MVDSPTTREVASGALLPQHPTGLPWGPAGGQAGHGRGRGRGTLPVCPGRLPVCVCACMRVPARVHACAGVHGCTWLPRPYLWRAPRVGPWGNTGERVGETDPLASLGASQPSGAGVQPTEGPTPGPGRPRGTDQPGHTPVQTARVSARVHASPPAAPFISASLAEPSEETMLWPRIFPPACGRVVTGEGRPGAISLDSQILYLVTKNNKYLAGRLFVK